MVPLEVFILNLSESGQNGSSLLTPSMHLTFDTVNIDHGLPPFPCWIPEAQPTMSAKFYRGARVDGAEGEGRSLISASRHHQKSTSRRRLLAYRLPGENATEAGQTRLPMEMSG